MRWVWPNGTWQTATGIVYLFIQFFMPLMLIIICYGFIIYNLSVRMQASPDNYFAQMEEVASRNKFQVARRNTLLTLVIVACCFAVCWSPNQVMYFMFNLGYDIDFNSTYSNFTLIMLFFNCTVNPFIYLFKYKDFQKAVKEFLSCCQKRETGSHSDTVANSVSTQL